MAIQQETELYAPVKQWLEQRGYIVKSEVKGCDIVALKSGKTSDEQPIIIELKKTFSLPLLYQAMDRLLLSPLVYVAVESSEERKRGGKKRYQAMVQLCRRLKIGLLTVRFRSNGTSIVQVLLDPSFEPSSSVGKAKPTPRIVRKQQALLKEFQTRTGDHNQGGMTRQKIMTAYREQALLYAYWLQHFGPTSTKALRNQPGVISAKVQPILHANVYGWFEPVERGVYRVTDNGERALKEYENIVSELLV